MRDGTSFGDVSAKIFVEELRRDLYDCQRILPGRMAQGQPKEGLRDKTLGNKCCMGIQIAAKRGLQCLMHDYLQEVARKDKEASSDLREDIDLESRTEQPSIQTLLSMLPKTEDHADVLANTFQRLKEESILAKLEATLQDLVTRFKAKDSSMTQAQLCLAAAAILSLIHI